jgi:HEAT repeat protein/photosystem II stability/assembly factor-like uncharacterized protein
LVHRAQAEARRILGDLMSTLKPEILRPLTPKSKAFVADIVVTDERVYLVGGTYHEPFVLTSADARTFYKRKTPDTPGLRSMLRLGDGRLLVCGEYGALYVSSDDGKEWVPIPTKTRACLYSLAEDGDAGLWCSGDDGFLLHSADGGLAWKPADIPTRARVSNVVADGKGVFLCCFDGTLYRLEDGKATKLFKGTAALTDLERTSHGVFVTGDGGQLWKSTDGTTFDRLAVVGKDVDLEGITSCDAGIFVVGARGTVLRSTDGIAFDLIDTDTQAHLYTAVGDNEGCFIGGEGGIFLQVRDPDFDYWTDRKDTLKHEVPSELDILFREADPDTFLTTGLLKVAGDVVDGTFEWEKEFEEIWGTAIPTEISAILRIFETERGRASFYEWRPENVIGDIANTSENIFEHLVELDQKNYLGTALVEAMTAQVYLGTYGNGDSHLASVYGEGALANGEDASPGGTRRTFIFDHEEHSLAFATATSVSRLSLLSAASRALHNEAISNATFQSVIAKLNETIAPSWHFRSTIEEAGVEELERYEEEMPYARVWYARGIWLIYLLRSDGVVQVEDIKRVFFPKHNPPLEGEVHERWRKSSVRLVPTALYCMLRSFFFDDPVLEEYLAIGRAHASKLARDCAQVIDDVLAGKRKGIGKIGDLLGLRTQFQKLDLDPRREAERQREAEERVAVLAKARAEAKERAQALPDPAGAAWADVHDLVMHEAIEARLREEPAMKSTWTAIDFVIQQRFVRENLVLDHEKMEEIEWLGQSGDVGVVPLLLGALLRPRAAQENDAPPTIATMHPNMAGEILEGFAHAGRLDRKAAVILRPGLAMEERYEHRRARITELIGLLGDVDALPALDKLVDWLPSHSYTDVIARKELAQATARALGRTRDARAIPPLMAMFNGPDDVSKKARSFVGMALAELGASECWKMALDYAGTVDRNPASWLLWAVGIMGVKADDDVQDTIIKAVWEFKPKWNAFYLELIKAGIHARLGAAPENFAVMLENAFNEPAWDAETTALQQVWAIRIVGVTDVPTAPVKRFLRSDHPMLRHAARDALERRGEVVFAPRCLHRAVVADLEREGTAALIAALEDETAIYRHVVAARLGDLKVEAARPALLRYARAVIANVPREVGATLGRDSDYPLRWTLKALLALGPAPELTTLLGELLVHKSRDVKDPVLRYAKVLPDDPGLIEPMLRVADEKYGWQESTATEWLEGAKAKHPQAYADAVERLRRGTS